MFLAALFSLSHSHSRGLHSGRLCALLKVVSDATMTTPGGTGTIPRTACCNILRVLGTPASIMGRSSQGTPLPGHRPFALPRPDALKALSQARYRVPKLSFRGAAMQRLVVAAYTIGWGCVAGVSPRRRFWLYRGGAMQTFTPL